MPTYQDNQPDFATNDYSNRPGDRFDPPARTSGGFLKGLLTGSLGASLLWLALGGTLWALQSRNPQPTATAPAAAPVASALDSSATSTQPAAPVAPSNTASGTTTTSPTTSAQPIAPDAAQPGVEQAPTYSGLNLQDSNRYGTTLRVDGVSFASDSIYLDIAATNGSSNEIMLNSLKLPLNNSAMYLVDDKGNEYPVVPPSDNTVVKIAPSSTAKGKFQFLGRVNPSATSLTLKTNPGSVGVAQGTPKFEIANIPVRR